MVINEDDKVLFEIINLRKEFPLRRSAFDVILRKPKKSIKAVDGINLTIYKNETLALVGESGCGKSSFARTVFRLYHPDSGTINFEKDDITHMPRSYLKDKYKDMQMVFQDPYSSLNPKMSAGDMIKEELLYHKLADKKNVKEKVDEIFQKVGLPPEAEEKFPGEFSGGQRQRIGIARAMALKPKFIIADEPVSALDVSIQAQILNLLQDLKEEMGLTMLFISHDLRVVSYIADRVAVMYLGKIVEIGKTEQLYGNSLHPYTKILLNSEPDLDPRNRREEAMIEGNPPSPIDLPYGCRFCSRCPQASIKCHQTEPELKQKEEGHMAACHNIA